MRKALKLISFLSATLVLFLVVSSFAFFYLIRVGELRRFLIDEVENNTELKVDLGAAELEVGWVTGVVFRDVALALAADAQPAISAARLTARVPFLPLLQRQVVLYEMHLFQPTAQIVRDKEGHIPVLDGLLNLPFLKRQDSEVNLDLRSIKVQNGDIEYTDQRSADGVGTWRLTDADVHLDRVRGQRLRDFMNDLFRRQPSERDGQALEFAVQSAVIKDNAKMNLRARGHLVFPKEALEFHEARWSADVELVNVPATWIRDQIAGKIPIKAMTGHLAQRVHVEGNPAEELRLKGDIDFRQLSVDAAELFLAPLTGVDGRVSFAANWSPQRLQVSRADFRTNEMKFILQGDVGALDGKDPHFRFTLTGLSAPFSALRKYLPVKVVDSPRLENTVNSIRTGQLEVKNAGVNATLGQLRRLAQSGVGSEVWFDAEVRDLAGTVSAERSFPMRGIEGQISLAKGIVTFRNIKGSYGDSRFTDIDGSYALSPAQRD